MSDIVGSLISAGANIFGGIENRDASNAANMRNLQFAQNQASGVFMPEYLANVVKGANAAGINPLAALGVSAPTGNPQQVGDTSFGQGISNAGQDIGRAVNAVATKDDKTSALNQQLLQAKIDNTNADTVSIMSRASSQARIMGQPGTPPSFPPLPTPDPRYEGGIEPAAQRFRMPDGSIAIEPSQKYTQSTFGTAPLAKLRTFGIETSDLPGLPAPRPDIFRNLGTPAPSDYNTP